MKLFVAFVLIVGAVYYGYTKYQENHSWILMVCKDKMPNGIECSDTSYEIPGYKTAKECLLDGTAKFSKEGFECGGGCQKKYGDLNVCKEICNSAGCNE